MNEGDGEKTLKGKEGATLGTSNLLFSIDFTANEGSGIPRWVKLDSHVETVCWQPVSSHTANGINMNCTASNTFTRLASCAATEKVKRKELHRRALVNILQLFSSVFGVIGNSIDAHNKQEQPDQQF